MSFLIEALTLGVVYGFGPCTIFCAPYIVPLIMASAKNGKEGTFQAFVFGLGRVTSYVILGALTGYLGYVLEGLISPQVIGIFMIALGIFILVQRHPKCLFLNKIKGKHTAFLSGMIIGISPCLPLVGAMLIAIKTMSPINGSLVGLLFGLGTLLSPLILLGFLAGWFAKRSEKFFMVNTIVCSAFMIILGLMSFFSVA